MQTPDHYRLTFTRRRAAAGTVTTADAAPADEVVVDRTDALGPGGNPVYSDRTGILRAEISPAGEVRMLATGVYQSPLYPSAEPLP
ncbi:DUF6296 family protein [Streptomyces sp. NPDC008313]|uniref:DUF6296 family protein n=1 Tax=Streptomyces sp. NPDC008313 TaxID=3364826 RepID=UPI0036F042E7